MCYEIHGGEEKYFNLISDTCTSVNARFSAMQAMPDVNRMRVIGMYAATSATPNGNCAEIEINIDSCSAYLDGEPVELMAQVDDIRIRKFNNRWRVSVPNCQRPSATMWITCEANMLRFRIARGSNLAPTSHGLLGQFWNIPMGVVTILNGEAVDFIQIYDSTHPKYRFIPAYRYSLTWDHTPMTCYYVGNAQGGPETSHDSMESVIEGSQSQYVTSSLFDPEFEYNQFETSHCSVAE
jgi:hypothetical protein